MLKSLLIASTMLLAAPVAATTVIDFDDLVGFGTVPTNYAGVNWDDNWSFYDSVQSPYNPASGATRIYSNYAKYPVAQPGTVAFYVGDGSIFSGAYFAGSSQHSVTIESWLDGALVGTSAALNTSDVPTFLASGYAGSVDEIRIVGNNGYYVVDDVTFDNLVSVGGGVPEPATWAMMLAGFGLVGFAARRRAVATA
jgi:hypothetical protein